MERLEGLDGRLEKWRRKVWNGRKRLRHGLKWISFGAHSMNLLHLMAWRTSLGMTPFGRGEG